MAGTRKVLPQIIPKAKELVEARLADEARVASYYLDRAGQGATTRFREPADQQTPRTWRGGRSFRRLFSSVVAKAYGVVMCQPEFAAEVMQHTVAEVLQGVDAVLGRPRRSAR